MLDLIVRILRRVHHAIHLGKSQPIAQYPDTTRTAFVRLSSLICPVLVFVACTGQPDLNTATSVLNLGTETIEETKIAVPASTSIPTATAIAASTVTGT